MEVFLWKILVMSLAAPVASLYEDQAGQFDWRTSQLGRIRHVRFDLTTYSSKRVILATESNALASINARTGQIVWRRVLDAIVDRLLHHSGILVTVSRGGSLVRSWDSSSGQLLWETSGTGPSNGVAEACLVTHSQGRGGYLVLVWSSGWLRAYGHAKGKEAWSKDLSARRSPRENDDDEWLLVMIGDEDDAMTCVVVTADASSSVVLHWVNVSNGDDVRPSERIPVVWPSRERSRCVITSRRYLVCVDGQLGVMHWLFVDAEKPQFDTLLLDTLNVRLSSDAPFSLESFDSDFLLTVSSTSVLLTLDAPSDKPTIRMRFSPGKQIYRGSLADAAVLFLLEPNQNSLEVTGVDAKTLEELPGIGQSVTVPSDLGQPEMAHVYMFHKKDKSLAYRMLLITSDDALSLVQQNGRVTWTREESLAKVSSVQMIDLPVSEGKTYLEGLYKDLVSQSAANPFTLFAQRISVQLAQFQALTSSSNGVNAAAAAAAADDESLSTESLTRDRFNLRKLIVVLTSVGKLFGIDSESGQFLWKLSFPDLVPLTATEKGFMMAVQRTAHSHPLPPQVVVIGSSKSQCRGSVLYTVNPLTGKLSPDERDHCLGYGIKHSFLLPVEDGHSTGVMMLIDTEKRAHVFPSTESAIESVKNHHQAIHVHAVDVNSSSVVGYKAVFEPQDSSNLRLVDAWTVQLPSDRKIVGYATRPSHERVNDQARILGDRSAMYKYLNPNLIALATEFDEEKGVVEVLIIDGVTGSIIYRVKQRQAKGPVHVVHSENWIVYTLWNARSRRHETTVLEMFESGSRTRNETHMSSLDANGHPQVLRKSFVFPTAVSTMGVTLTEKGITSKSVLFGLHNGTIFAVPKVLLDPRRPLVLRPVDSEEELIPYIPILFMGARDFVNYNQTVSNIAGLVTVPAGLESTCLLFAYGLDLYFTRLTPSRKFDVLADDFDSKVIITVLLGLTLAAFLSAKLARRKQSQSAWK